MMSSVGSMTVVRTSQHLVILSLTNGGREINILTIPKFHTFKWH